ncbi:centrosomal protein of 55 kDa-like [Papaver somniferum]|uniref:centrosomal protein of 55 kDa-like n=1 Tax=Papaver somniferum TaxID=3469 RepID=UPI000E6FE338|nr:centrosomal protein of 55 kDa-like [Papaver somniferum]
MRSRALDSLVTFSADDFLSQESSVLLNASMNLYLQQHSACMNQEVNRHMASLVEIRLVREKAKKDEAQIKFLTNELQEEKEHSIKQSQKMENLLTRCMQRQANASEASASLEDIRAENLNFVTQNDCYVSENQILNEKVETLFSQVDRLSIDCSRNEELNYHLHDENGRLKLEFQRVSNSLTNSRNLHSSSLVAYRRLKEDNERVINSKDKIVADLRKSRNKVTGLNEEIHYLKKKVELLQAQLDNSSRPRSIKSSSQAQSADSRKNKGALVIHPDKDTSNSDHERHKSQVLRLSQERDEFRTEVSRLKNEVSDLNTDMDEMIETSAKRCSLMTSKPKDDRIISCEEEGINEDEEERKIDEAKVEEEDSKGASASNGVGLSGAGDVISEDVPLQQQP